MADPFGPAGRAACTAPATWCAGAPTGSWTFLGPRRLPGEAPRLPHRARRDRGGAGRPSGGRQAVVAGARGPAGRRAAGRATWSPRRGASDWTPQRCARHCAASAAGLHGARGGRGARRAAADRQRQARPRRAAGARSDARRRRIGSRATPTRGDPVRASSPRCWGWPAVGIDDDFFDLGGTRCWPRLVSRARAALDVELPVSGRVRGTDRGRARGGLDGASGRVRRGAGLRSAAMSERRPLSFAQQRLWFLNRFEGRSPPTTCRWAIRLRGALDQDAVRQALDDVIDRHESLRTPSPSWTGPRSS